MVKTKRRSRLLMGKHVRVGLDWCPMDSKGDPLLPRYFHCKPRPVPYVSGVRNEPRSRSICRTLPKNDQHNYTDYGWYILWIWYSVTQLHRWWCTTTPENTCMTYDQLLFLLSIEIISVPFSLSYVDEAFDQIRPDNWTVALYNITSSHFCVIPRGLCCWWSVTYTIYSTSVYNCIWCPTHPCYVPLYP